jgi:transcriptional regulator with PAS, ATPase and Fis domain/tetratricopeptide (TPR) repeat protein
MGAGRLRPKLTVAGPHTTELSRLRAHLEEATDEADRAATAVALGALLARVGDHDQALLHLNAARRYYRSGADRVRQAELEGLIATSCTAKGEVERAVTHLTSGLEIAGALDDAILEGRLRTELGLALLAGGETDRARRELDTARLLFEPHGVSAPFARALRGLAQVALAGEDLEAGAALLERALNVAEQVGEQRELGLALLDRATVHHRVGDLRAAKRAYRRAIACFADHELPRDLAEAYHRYGLFIGEAQEALPEGFADPPAFWLAKAQELFREHGAIADLERVRDGFRRFGRRGTDRVADVEVLGLIQEIKEGRLEVRREVAGLVDRCRDWLTRLGALGTPELRDELEAATEALGRTDRLLVSKMDTMAASEERFLGALNTVVLERENIRTLLELGRALNQLGEPAQIAQDAVRMAGQLTGADRVLLCLRDDDGTLRLRASLRIGEAEAHEWHGVVERTARGGGPALLEGSATGHRHLVDAAGARVKLGYAIVTPLRLQDKIFGVIYADKELCGGVFTEHDLDLLVIFCSQVATILENVRIAEEMRVAARTRTVTLEAISDGVMSVAPDGRVTGLNSLAARLLGVTIEQVGKLTLAQLGDLAFLQVALTRGEEIDSRSAHVGAGEFLVNGHIVRGEDGAVLGLVATFTEMKRAQSLAQRIVGSPARFSFGDIVGAGPMLRKQIHLAEAAARSDSSLLITGESGTGKELFAQAVHNAGPRAAGPFVGINCAAIPRELLESELFGYEAGAFTGAKRGGHPGKFELAEGGTILLDEIGDMPLEMQAKLLRVLQEKRVQRIGGTRDLRLDARVIATTNRDLSEDVERGRFRQDLFFRLKVIHLPLPPLRERPEDIPPLVNHFLALFAARLGKQVHAVAPELMRAFVEYPWPGNVRELENVLESEINLIDDDRAILAAIPEALRPRAGGGGLRGADPSVGHGAGPGGSLGPPAVRSIEDAERELLRAALVQHRGKIPDVAQALGISRGTVYNKMRKFKMDPLEFR